LEKYRMTWFGMIIVIFSSQLVDNRPRVHKRPQRSQSEHNKFNL
jgi:hypothetical protein